MMRALVATCLTLAACPALAAPPPPPPAFIRDAAAVLAAGPSERTFDAYGRLFADDLHVTVDGRVVAPDRRSWLALERSRLPRAERRLVGHSEGADTVLVVDEFDDRTDVPDIPTAVFDPRFVTRALRYRFGEDHRIHELIVIQGGGFWIRGGAAG